MQVGTLSSSPIPRLGCLFSFFLSLEWSVEEVNDGYIPLWLKQLRYRFTMMLEQLGLFSNDF